jgi:hypothetical protein
MLGTLRHRADPTFHYSWVRVEPPLPLQDGPPSQEVALSEAWEDTRVDRLSDDWLPVYVFEVVNRSAFEQGSVDQTDLSLYGRAEVAKSPSLLPKTQEEYWDQSFALLQRFVAREGHADVPADHKEDGKPVGNWVGNMKYMRAWRNLRPEWESRLESLPGWRWLSGDDFFLLARFAVEQRHTRVPLDYVDEGRPIGEWVKELRKTYAMGMLAKDWIRRLERIPGWEW